MLFVFSVHLDLVVPREAIHKRHSLKATGVVNHDINDGQWKLIFRAGCIKIVIVNTDSDFFHSFKNGDNVSNPVQVLFLLYEITFDEFMNFNFNSFHDVRVKPSLLFHWLDVRLNV